MTGSIWTHALPFQQSGKMTESGSQTRLPDAHIITNNALRLYFFKNLNSKLDFNPNLTNYDNNFIYLFFFSCGKQLLERIFPLPSQMKQ